MTDKEKIIAEIERLLNLFPKPNGEVLPIDQNAYNLLSDLKIFIASLPAEQPSEELEEEIKRKYKSDNALMMPIEDFRKLIIHFTDWQKEQMMKSAINGIMDCDNSNEWVEITDRFVVTPSRAGKKVKAILFMEDKQLNNKVNVEPPSFEEFNSYNVALNG